MTLPIDIRPCDLNIVQDILCNTLPKGAKVWVFGSRATWTTKDSSDLDLAIDAGRPLTRQESGSLSEAFDESNLPYKVDIVDMQTVSENFKKIIERDKVGLTISNDRKVKVGEFCPFVYGRALPAHKRNESGKLPVYGSSGIIGYHTEALTSGSTIIVGRKGTIGQVYFSKMPCWPIDTTFYVEGSQNRDIRYVYYALQSLGLEQMNGDSAVPGLNREHAHNQELPNKTLYEQKAIAEILGSLDDKIELNRRMNQTLEAMAQALFKDWFVDFGPTRAKMSGQPAYLPQDIWDLFPDKLDDEGKPEGWEVKSLTDIACFLNGLALQKFPPHGNTFLPIVKIAELRQGITNKSDKAAYDIPNDYIINDGDVLFSWSGSLLLSVWTGGKAALNQHLFKVTSKHYPQWFYYSWVQLHMPRFRSIATAKATTMGHIQRIHLEQAETRTPPSALMQKMDEIFSPIFEKKIHIYTENKKISDFRDYLLPKLLSEETGLK